MIGQWRVETVPIKDESLDTMEKVYGRIFALFDLSPRHLTDDGSNGSSRLAREAVSLFRLAMKRRWGVEYPDDVIGS